jgi:4-hydroxy-tetrahydrodipicolinate synthase
MVELLADPPPDFAVLGGDDAVISPLLALGAHGGILASAQCGQHCGWPPCDRRETAW